MTEQKRIGPITYSMHRMLRNIADGKDAKHGIRGGSARGGADGTLQALYRRGLADWDPELLVHITDKGRAVLEAGS